MTIQPSEADYDYYLIIKLASGGVLSPKRIPSITSTAQIQAHANSIQASRPLDQVSWTRYLG